MAILAAVLLAAYLVVPERLWLTLPIELALGCLAAGAMVLAVRRLPRADRVPWWLFAAGVAANESGVLFTNYLPAHADAAYLTYYPCVTIGLVLLIRRQRSRSRRAALVDAATITVGLGLIAWVYAIQPALADVTTSPFERLIRVSYLGGDLVLIALTVLLIRNGVRRQKAPNGIAVAQLVFLAGDIVWLVVGTLQLDVSAHFSRGVDTVYLASFVLFGYASRWAGDTLLDEPPGAPPRSGVPLMLTLAAALLVGPALLVEELTHGAVQHVLAIAIGCAIMSMLVVTRMFQLLRHSEQQALVVRELSRRDELTGLPNRRAWVDELPKVLDHAGRLHDPVSVGMIDLDRFKLYNDRYGHPAGDRLLKAAAAAWSGALRRSDILARYGGEEFIVLLPGAGPDQATMVLERVRAVTPDDQTFSAGLATWDGTESADDLIARADTALYQAKAAGRDRIISASDPGLPMPTKILGP